MIDTLRVLACSVALGAAADAIASEIEIPLRLQSTIAAVEIDVDGADIGITCGQDETSTLLVRPRNPEITSKADLAVAQRGAVLTVTGAADPVSPPEVVLELTVPPGLPVTVIGSDLRIVRSCEVAPDAIPLQQPAAPEPADALESPVRPSLFELDRATVEYRGPGDVRFAGSDNEITLTGTAGNVELVTTGGGVDVSAHSGGVLLDATATVAAVRSLEGRLNARVDDGRLEIVDAAGEAVIELADSSLDAEDHNGALSVTASLSDVTIRRGVFPRLVVTGEGSTVRLSDCAATGTVNLVGGGLDIDGWTGRLSLQGRTGADLEVAALDGDAVVMLDDASCRLDGVTGHTRATTVNAELDLSNLKSIELTAQGSRVVANEIREVKLVNLTDGELTFTSTVARGRQRVELFGEVWARVELPVPCEVHLYGAEAGLANVDVRGCDLHGADGSGTQRPRRRLTERQPVIFNVKLEAEAKLRVDGRSN